MKDKDVKDPRTEALDNLARTGKKVTLRAAVAFHAHPQEWMSIEEVADIIGLMPSTVKTTGVRELLNAQVVERKYTYDSQLEPTALYRLNAMDAEVDALLEKKRSKTPQVREDIGIEPKLDSRKPKPQPKRLKSQPKFRPKNKDTGESPKIKTQSKSGPKVNPSSDPRTGDRLEIRVKRDPPPPEASPKKGVESFQEDNEDVNE